MLRPRAQHEGEEIGRRTREALARLKQSGVKLGNRRNLREAQLKGVATVKNAAVVNRNAFEEAVARANVAGAKSAREIVGYFEEIGFTTPRGQEWTQGNFHRATGKSKAARKTIKLPASIAGPDRVMTAAGIECFERAMRASGFKVGRTEKLMAAMGFSPFDVSISEALECRRPLKENHHRALEKWISMVEAREH